MNISVLGAGAGGAATVVELCRAGHTVTFWGRSSETMAPFRANGGVAYEGVWGDGFVKPRLITNDLGTAVRSADAAVVALPTYSHASMARAMAASGLPSELPIILNPGHTGGALEFSNAFRSVQAKAPPIAEFSTLTYVARKYRADCVAITGRAKQVRLAALPGGRTAIDVARELFPGASPVADVLAADLANVNMVLHPPGAILAAAWVEARRGDFTFYVDAMTPGVARVMARLDAERLAVAKAFGHNLPNLLEEMKLIGTVEPGAAADFAAAIRAGKANQAIRAPDLLNHRYYREDFGHGLLPFIELGKIAGVAVPTASALFEIAETVCGVDFRVSGRTAESMGIAALSCSELMQKVGMQ